MHMTPRPRRSVARALSVVLTGVVAAGLTSCASAPPPQPVAIAAFPREIRVSEWPYWIDIPMAEKNPDRIWRVVVDVIGERAAVATMDRESGYMRTEYKPTEVKYGAFFSEERYTVRIRPAESKIRLGVEVRFRGTNTYVGTLVNVNGSPWTAVYRELQQRLEGM